MNQQRIDEAIRAHQAAIAAVAKQGELVRQIAELIGSKLMAGGKLLLFGNGGSAADAQHIAAEFVNRFQVDREPFAAIALTTDTSVLTSIGNDYAYEQVFARQVRALAGAGDVVVGLTTSGKSPNVIEAMRVARDKGATSVGFTGKKGAEVLGKHVDLCFAAEAEDTARIQEVHMFTWHLICGMVEDILTRSQLAARP